MDLIIIFGNGDSKIVATNMMFADAVDLGEKYLSGSMLRKTVHHYALAPSH